MRPSTDEALLVQEAAARLYGAGQEIWDSRDKWNSIKRASIDRFARENLVDRFIKAPVVLDLGSGSQPYDWLPSCTISVDRFWEQVQNCSTPVVGSVDQLPFGTSTADIIVCVASVLNYVPAAESIIEFSRVTKQYGHLLLHFETSTSLEYILKTNWRMPVSRVKTLNSGREDNLWVYNPSYIYSLLSSQGFRVRKTHCFHIASALGLRLGISQQRAAPFAKFDRLFAPLSRFSDDVILLAEKI